MLFRSDSAGLADYNRANNESHDHVQAAARYFTETDDMKFTKRVSYENMRYSFCMRRGRKSCLLD